MDDQRADALTGELIGKPWLAKFDGWCEPCHTRIQAGIDEVVEVVYNGRKQVVHESCSDEAEWQRGHAA